MQKKFFKLISINLLTYVSFYSNIKISRNGRQHKMLKFKWKNKTIKSTQKTDNILLLIIGGLVASITPKLVNWFLLLQDNINIFLR